LAALVAVGLAGICIPLCFHLPARTYSWIQYILPGSVLGRLLAFAVAEVLAYFLIRRFDRTAARVYGILALLGTLLVIGFVLAIVAMFWDWYPSGGM
jgi:hypothetical protein